MHVAPACRTRAPVVHRNAAVPVVDPLVSDTTMVTPLDTLVGSASAKHVLRLIDHPLAARSAVLQSSDTSVTQAGVPDTLSLPELQL